MSRGGDLPAAGAPFVHRALLYRRPAEAVAAAEPFLREALDAGGAALAVLPRERAAALREALGADAGRVAFEDADLWYARLGPLFERLGRTLAERPAGEPFRIVAEHPRPVRRPREYARYEAMVNVAFAPVGAGLLCLHDASADPPQLCADVLRTHPELVVDGDAVPNALFTEPADFMRRAPGALPPPPGDAPAMRLAEATDLALLRRFVREHAAAAGLAPRAIQDLQLAVSETATNAIVHTPGPGDVRLWRQGGEVVCEVRDAGPGIGDPLAGYRLPAGDAGSGRGLWLARQLCDEVVVRSGPGGTVVRLHVELRG